MGGHARHQAVWDDLVQQRAPDERTRERCTRTSPGGSCRATTTSPWSGSTRSTLGGLRPDRGGHPADPQRHRLPRRPRAHGRLLLAKLLRWLTARPSRVMSVASKPFYSVADRISQFLEDIAEFFGLFQTMAPGFVGRPESVKRTLADSARPSSWSRRAAARGRALHRGPEQRNLHLGAGAERLLPSTAPATTGCGAWWPGAATGRGAGAVDAGGRRGAVGRCWRRWGELPQLPGRRQREANSRRPVPQPRRRRRRAVLEADIHDLAGLLAPANRSGADCRAPPAGDKCGAHGGAWRCLGRWDRA